MDEETVTPDSGCLSHQPRKHFSTRPPYPHLHNLYMTANSLPLSPVLGCRPLPSSHSPAADPDKAESYALVTSTGDRETEAEGPSSLSLICGLSSLVPGRQTLWEQQLLSHLGGRDGELQKNTLKMPALFPDLSGRRNDSWQTRFGSPASFTQLAMPPCDIGLAKNPLGCLNQQLAVPGMLGSLTVKLSAPTVPLHPASSGYLLTWCQLLPSPVLARGRVMKEAIHSEQSWAAVHMARPSMDAGPCPLF